MAKIYKVTNLINNKIYIGQTTINNKHYKGGGKILRKAILKYGWINFKMETIIEGNFNSCLLDELEIHYIHLYNSRNKNVGYNIDKGGRSQKKQKKPNKIKETYKQEKTRLLKEKRDWAEKMLGKKYKFKEPKCNNDLNNWNITISEFFIL